MEVFGLSRAEAYHHQLLFTRMGNKTATRPYGGQRSLMRRRFAKADRETVQKFLDEPEVAAACKTGPLKVGRVPWEVPKSRRLDIRLRKNMAVSEIETLLLLRMRDDGHFKAEILTLDGENRGEGVLTLQTVMFDTWLLPDEIRDQFYYQVICCLIIPLRCPKAHYFIFPPFT